MIWLVDGNSQSFDEWRAIKLRQRQEHDLLMVERRIEAAEQKARDEAYRQKSCNLSDAREEGYYLEDLLDQRAMLRAQLGLE